MNNRFVLIIAKYFSFFAFFFCLLLFWPGLMRSDSLLQMQQGLSLLPPSDFHPPMMGFIWGLFSKIYEGPGVLFVLHLALYWGAVALFANAKKSCWVYLIAILPPVFSYQLLVIKDVSFVNAYLFCAGWLHFYSMRKSSPNYYSVFIWFVVAFYGTCAAYQSIIALPWLCLWFSKVCWPQKAANWIKKGIAITGALGIAMLIFNSSLTVSSHRIQHNELYDLAGISVYLNTPLFPDYIKQHKDYDFERIKKLYNPRRVDDLVFLSDTPVHISSSPEELKALRTAWISAIFAYPMAYFKHRWDVFYQQLTMSLLKRPGDIKEKTTPLIVEVLNWVEIAGVFSVLSLLMAYAPYFGIQLFLVYKGFRYFKSDPKYVNLFFQNIMGIALVSSLFFVASAAEARYAYLAVAMFYFSFPILKKDIINR